MDEVRGRAAAGGYKPMVEATGGGMMGDAGGFPRLKNSGKAVAGDGGITFSYLDSQSSPVTETLPPLTATGIIRRVKDRMKRFEEAPPGSRESDGSRSERKYIAAQPEKVLREAWNLMSEGARMEFAMMLDANSHHGISDPGWLDEHAESLDYVPGDDGGPLEVDDEIRRA